jgi:hypothetical protein
MREVTIRYPVPLRAMMVLGSTLLVAGIATSVLHGVAIFVVTFSLVGIAIYVLSYRIQIDQKEIRLRYLPFLGRSVLMRDVTGMKQKGTLVLLTNQSTIPLRGLSPEAMVELLETLPPQIQELDAPEDEPDPQQSLRQHLRRACWSAVGLVVTIAVITPFAHGMPWSKYWNTIARNLVWLAAGFYLLLIFQLIMAFLDWRYLRAIRKIQENPEDDGPENH